VRAIHKEIWMNSRTKNILFWVVVGLFMILLFNLFSVPHHEPEEDVIFSEFMTKLDKGEVERVIIKSSHISAILKDKTRIRTYSCGIGACRSRRNRRMKARGTLPSL
jgi:ATP-dependent Zn protease